MRLLICTQKVDERDPVLGFFHEWIKEFAKRSEFVTVICLFEGQHNLPKNVKVLSLGKEFGKSKLKYICRFYKYIWQERKNYDSVFVHMNQEYVLLGSICWKFLGFRVSMWRNHHGGNFLTKISIFLVDHIFCTSRYSYTADSKKTTFMPVGVDDNVFVDKRKSRLKNSILFLGRISPAKRLDLLVDSVKELKNNDLEFGVSVVGDPSENFEEYYANQKERVSKNEYKEVSFLPPVSNKDTVGIYNRHELFVNLSTDGMFDKTIFEAMLCGCLVLVSNKNLIGKIDDMFILKYSNPIEISKKIEKILSLDEEQKKSYIQDLIEYARGEHSSNKLFNSLFNYFKNERKSRANIFQAPHSK